MITEIRLIAVGLWGVYLGIVISFWQKLLGTNHYDIENPPDYQVKRDELSTYETEIAWCRYLWV